MKQKKNAGYTLIELIVVIAILAIIVGIVVKVYVGHVEKSRAAACASNRDELYSEISTEYTAEEYSSLKLAFIGVMDERYNGRELCPSGGVYSWVDGENGMEQITCSVHGNPGTKPGEGEGENTYPGTDCEIKSNVWPLPEKFPDEYQQLTLKPSGIFEWEGEYWVICREFSLTREQAASGPDGKGPGGVTYDWFPTEKLTGRILTMKKTDGTINGVTRGDILEYEGEYYVFNDGGEWGVNPDNDTKSQWYKIPK